MVSGSRKAQNADCDNQDRCGSLMSNVFLQGKQVSERTVSVDLEILHA